MASTATAAAPTPVPTPAAAAAGPSDPKYKDDVKAEKEWYSALQWIRQQTRFIKAQLWH